MVESNRMSAMSTQDFTPFGSINSRKAANEERQRIVIWNGFMCKIKKCMKVHVV